MTDYKLLLIGFCFLLTGCEQKEVTDIPEEIKQLENLTIVEDAPVSDIEFTFEHSFGSSEEVLMGYIMDLVVNDDGDVFLGDYLQKTILIFDDKGNYQERMGREGLGPGEFQLIVDMKARGNVLQVFDRVQFRMNMFDMKQRTLIDTENVLQYPRNNQQNRKQYEEIGDWFPNPAYPLYGNYVLNGFMEHPMDTRINRDSYNLGKERMIKYYLMDYEGFIISDMVFQQRDREDLVANVGGEHLFHIHPPVPFLGKTIIAISEKNMIYTAWSRDFLIKAFQADGSYSKAYYVPEFSKRKIDRSELLQLFDENDTSKQKLVQHAELSEFWPSIFTIVTDDEGRIWVATISKGENLIEWWVFDKEGELLARADMPGELHLSWLMQTPLIVIKDGYFYHREQDDQTGEDRIVKYKIEFKSNDK